MIEIYRFSEENQEVVKNLILEIMGHEFGGDQTAYPTDDIEKITSTYGGLGEAFFVARDGKKVVGCVGIKKEDSRIALLRRLFVAVPYRNRQIGLKLIESAIEFCHQVGYQEVVFRTTSSMQGAIKACQKKGFVLRGKLQLGPVELLKFSLSIRDELKSLKA